MGAKQMQSPLHDRHVTLEAKMGEDGGFLMPLSYGNALEEAILTRRRAGVFDMSNGGRFRFRGDGALELLERLCTADVVHQEDCTSMYTLLCNERGGIVADGYLLRLEDCHLLVTSPGTYESALEHIQRIADDFYAKVDDQTEKTACIAVTGPAAAEILDLVLPLKVSHLPQNSAQTGSMLIAKYIASRMSFFGQWGLEVVLPNLLASKAWMYITQKAGEQAIKPAGVAASDILRIESGMVRFGHEINQAIDPITAGLESAIDFTHDFLGRMELQKIKARGPGRKRIGLLMSAITAQGKEGNLPTDEIGENIFLFDLQDIIPRQGATVLDNDGAEIGTVTSGTYSPNLSKVLAMAYVGSQFALSDLTLKVDIQGKKHDATVVALPFLK